jgi:biopolymer transport protein ExbB
MYYLVDYYSQLMRFMDSGGDVLWLIAILSLCMWTIIIERVWYYRTELKTDVNAAMDAWEARSERKSWHAKQVRRLLISQAGLSTFRYFNNC